MSSKIIRLTVSNMLRIEAAEVTPDGALVIVAGPNDAGKSSILNCIGLALSGKNVPPQPIRQGQSSGEIILETETLIVTRTFSASGRKTLEVRDKEKGIVTSPQSKLDALYRLTTFDPLTFTRLKPQEQASTLRDLAGLDTSDLDNAYNTKFADRTEIGRKVKDQQGRVNGIQRDTTAPAEVVSVADLTKQLQDANTKNFANDKAREGLADLNDVIDSTANIVELRRKYLAEMEAKVATAKADLAAAEQERQNAIVQRNEAKTAIDALADVDTKPILEQMQNAEAINAKVRANELWKAEHAELVRLQGVQQKLTEELQGILGTKESRIAKATLPIEGLGFDENGVTFEKVPFEQCSSSKQIRVSLAIACALNPELKVMLIRDGSLLDEKSMELVREFAEKHEASVWMECVGNREDATVQIEEGNVVATPAATAKAKKKAVKTQ